ncbi:MAG: polysaccharide pyruvyl transferase family protein [Nostoc sp. TH1S01]|nr:polysaccharide pyruvyl transferase family protein [Nostoc sp. TH1S01]
MAFDFYGSGNIGDDLMVAGFQEALSTLNPEYSPKVFARTKHNLNCQKLRFPNISWINNSKSFDTSADHYNEMECWAGVGDTPFQLTSGDWFLNFLLSETKQFSHFKHKVLVSVGAETEIQPKLKEFSQVAKLFDRISVRDEHTYAILVDKLKVPSQKVFLGADLANISLPMVLADCNQAKEFNLGLIVASETLSKKDIQEVGIFIAAQSEPVAFLAGETRNLKNSESYIFSRLTRFPCSRARGNIVLKFPDYNRGSLYDLVQPLCACKTVISSRYHCLLSAAWAGCKVAAIGRSSKVIELAKELNIPYCTFPITSEKLENLFKEATIVSNKLLLSKRDKALAGVAFCFS